MASTSTQLPELEAALSALPKDFARRVVDAYNDLKSAWASRQYDLIGLRAGKYCEVLIRLLQLELTGQHTPFGTSLGNLEVECQRLQKLSKSKGPESLRILIPRCLSFVYTLRNKRAIGHVGGDLDANEIDAATALRCVDWSLSELIRSVHTLSIEEAQELLDSIAEREVVAVWAIAGKKRVLDPSKSRTEQTLMLLYSEPDTAVLAEDLASWVEASRLAEYRRDVLRPLHRKRLIEFDAETDTAVLSPTGAEAAEALLL
jgi:hypothetical protein